MVLSPHSTYVLGCSTVSVLRFFWIRKGMGTTGEMHAPLAFFDHRPIHPTISPFVYFANDFLIFDAFFRPYCYRQNNYIYISSFENLIFVPIWVLSYRVVSHFFVSHLICSYSMKQPQKVAHLLDLVKKREPPSLMY